MPPHTSISPALVCRPALPLDTSQVLELSSHIWEGHDYIPSVWQDWLAAPNGLLCVAEFGGKIVGFGKLTRLSASQWWLEGLRVHPEFEGRGIASHIHDYLLECWLQHEQGVIRLTTSSERVKVHRMCAHRGFVKTGEYTVYGAPVIDEPVSSFIPILPEEIPQALEFVQQSPTLPLLNGLIDHGWRWGEPSAEGLEKPVLTGNAWWWRDKQGLLTYWDDEDENKKYPVLHLIACSLEALPECLLDFRRLAVKRGYDHVEWNAPHNPELLPLLEKAGFKQCWDEVLFLFEKKHPGSG
jgi:GNAT superfamily N-acetyltransferase